MFKKKYRFVNARFCAIIFVLFLGVALSLPEFSYASADNDADFYCENIDSIIDVIKKEYGAEIFKSKKFISQAGTSNFDWLAFSLGRYGYKTDYSYYLGVASDYIEKKYSLPDKLSGDKPTEWHRLSLATAASGGSSQNMGEHDGKNIDIYNDGIFYKSEAQYKRQGLPAYFWALITINALQIPEPQNALTTKQDIIDYIVTAQNLDGSFAFFNDIADADMTAMALTALAKENSSAVIASKNKAIDALSKIQQPDGTFASRGVSNSASTAWSIVALNALNIDFKDERFVKNGNSALDALQKFRLGSGGYSQNIGEAYNEISTIQVLYAYIAAWRSACNEPALFDLSDVSSLINLPILTQSDKQMALDFKNKKLIEEDYIELVRLKYLININEYNEKNEQLAIVKECLNKLKTPAKNVNVWLIVVCALFVAIISLSLIFVIRILVKKHGATHSR